MLDLAVVGGGLAGSYLAYRIGQLRPDWSVTLFESSSRIGGRLLSVRVPGIEGVPAELGGMRYRSSQPLISAIVKELGLQTRPFPVTHDDNRYYLRDSHLRAHELSDPSKAPYDLGAPFRGLSPAELIVSAFETVVPGASDLSEEGWQYVRRNHRFNGRRLNEWGLQDLLRSVIGDEGYRFLTDGLGYSSIFGNWNAAEAIPWFLIETRPDSENETLVAGMEQLPRELINRFLAAGGSAEFGYHLEHIDAHSRDGQEGFGLLFGNEERETARRVVLALPLAAIRSVVEESPLLRTSQMSTLLDSVTAHPMTKVFLAYDRAWWRHAGIIGRRSVSDLPLRKTYFFDESGSSPDAPALLLASYCDGESVDYWRRFAHVTSLPDDADAFDSSERWGLYAAPEGLVEDAHRQLMQLHPDRHVTPPMAGASLDWGAKPYEGAWHAWRTSVKPWEVLPHLLQPVQHAPIFVCGETFSSWQGWMEGALETADAIIDPLTNAS